ncbi:MAG: fibronectin type III domain-containing protein [bacterium]
MRKILILLALLSAALQLSACGGGTTGSSQDFISAADNSGSGPGTGSGLPALSTLDELPAGSRSASLLGPGWYELWHEDIRDSAFLSLGSGNDIVLNAGGGNAYALYCLRGFNSDFSPTSVRITPQSGSDTPYTLLFADYASGRWTSGGLHIGTVQVDLPGTTDGSRHPLDYVSPAGRVYVTVVSDQTGVDLKIDNIEIGIHGGLLAPRPPARIVAGVYADGSVANWDHSPDYGKPDFGGYVVERRDLLSDEWLQLASTGPLETSVVIPGIRTTFSYRVAAFDVSGNQSAWTFSVDGGLVIGSKIMQVAVDMPRGPLYGPVEVNFDMSASSTPEGTIAEYKVLFENSSLNYTGASPTVSRVLQPGCYYIRFEVNDGTGISADYGETTRTLIVYPQWESSPLIVREADRSFPVERFSQVSGIIDPDTDELVIFADDLTLPGTTIRRGRPGNLSFDSVPFYGTTPNIYTDPVILDGTAYVGVQPAGGGSYMIASNASGSHIIEGSFGFTRMLPVTDGEKLFMLISSPTGIGILDLEAGFGLTSIYTGLTGNNYMDACWNPVTETIDILYDDAGLLAYGSWDPLSMSITDDDSGLADSLSEGIDVEADPDSGELCVITRSFGKTVFLRKPVTAAISAPQDIDTSVTNFWPADLAWHNGNPYCVFAGGSGQTRNYRLDSSGAVTINVSDYTPDGFYTGCLLHDWSSGALLLCDRDASAGMYIVQLNPDDTETVLDYIRSDHGWGRWLDSAYGADGFHLIMAGAFLTGISHMQSADGESWTETGTAASDGYADLFDNRGGEVFLTLRSSTGYDVSYWNGSGWENRWIVPGTQTREAVSAGNRASSFTGWLLDDTDTPSLLRSQGNAAGFTTSSLPWPETTNVHKGRLVYDASYGITPAFVLYSRPALFQSFGLLNPYIGTVQHITGFSDGSLSISDLSAFDDRETAGRTMEMMPFRGNREMSNSTQLACWSVNGHNGSAFRYTFRSDGGVPMDPQLTDLPFRNSEWRSEEVRRTVSSAQANGLTAVSVMSSLDGKHSHMEWSCFGDWEELPLPDTAGLPSQAELLVDPDGRWYLFWRDPESGNVYCQRTLP